MLALSRSENTDQRRYIHTLQKTSREWNLVHNGFCWDLVLKISELRLGLVCRFMIQITPTDLQALNSRALNRFRLQNPYILPELSPTGALSKQLSATMWFTSQVRRLPCALHLMPNPLTPTFLLFLLTQSLSPK